MDLPDLADTITPKDMPEGLLTKLQLEADNLNAKYLRGVQTSYVPPVPTASPVAPASPVQTSGVPINPESVITNDSNNNNNDVPWNTSVTENQPDQTATNNANGPKPCFGNLNLSNKDCLICPHTIECSQASAKK